MFLRRPRPAALAAALACAVGLAAAPAAANAGAAAAGPLPSYFVGMNIDGPLYPDADGIDLSKQMSTMVASGVESVRVVFDWSYAQPYANWSDVPAAEMSEFTDVNGVPTRFGQMDQLVGLAAEHGLTVLPTVIYTPSWDSGQSSGGGLAVPARAGPYAAFCAALVGRYGVHGTFWNTHYPKVPIRLWQIWNEPNLSYYWPKQPFATSYVKLLRAAHNAIKAADPSAKVALAGLPDLSWESLKSIYRIRGASKLFDVVSLHPYTKQPKGVIEILQFVRQVMVANGGAHTPMIADEISWPSSKGHSVQSGFDIGTTEAGQAKNIAAVLPLLGKYRRALNLIGFDYYTWASPDDNGGNQFDFAGLFHYSSGSFTAKPAYAAFRRAALALESCHKRSTIASICATPG